MNLRHFLQHAAVTAAIALCMPAAIQAENQPSVNVEEQQQLFQLLRETPNLAGAVVRDPSLLSEQSYIQRTNPQLAQFLAAHPEIAHNPDYSLFTNLPSAGKDRQQALERELWPEYLHRAGGRDAAELSFVNNDLVPVIVIPSFFFAIVWSIRALVAGRRQSKLLKAQSDLQSHLIDKLGSSQELTAYLASDAGQKLLSGFGAESLSATEPAQKAFTFERVLRPLQIGVLLVLLSVGVFAGHWIQPDSEPAFVWLAILLLAAGLGSILSAGLAWMTAKRFGLLPPPAQQNSAFASTSIDSRS